METPTLKWRQPEETNHYEQTDNESSGLSNNDSDEPVSPSSDTQTTPPISRPSSPDLLTCTVCLNTSDIHNRQTPTTQCTHIPTICLLCVKKHISLAVLTNGLTAVPCPEVGCDETLEYSDVIKGAKNDKACLDRYEELLLRRMLQTDPNFVWCKSTTCEWGQIHESGDDAPIVICQVCQSRSCFTHDVPWHAEQTCDEYDAEQAGYVKDLEDKLAKVALDNVASEDYIREHAKACPHPACGRNIEKNEGCDHMTCRCGHEFCWVCLADYGPIRQSGNQNHTTDCKYYA